MARGRKKKKIVEQTNVVSTQPIDYQGSITLTIKHGNRTLGTRKYKNSGMPNLFKFLAMSIAGEKATTLRPVQIKLFRYEAAEKKPSDLDYEENYVSPDKFNWATAFSNPIAPIAASSYIRYDTTPVIAYENKDSAKKENNYYTTTFHFRIPFSYITERRIHLIGLFPDNVISVQNDVSAYYKLTDEVDNTKWAPLELDDVAGNYSLIFEWVLSFTNKTI